MTSPGVTARWQLWSEKSQVRICKLPAISVLRLCSTRNIQFHFRGNLTLIDLNAAALIRLNQNWQIVVCTEPVREAVKHVARTLRMPMICLPLPPARLGTMKGFESDLVELRNQNALIADSLVCFPAGHVAGVPLAKELVHRSDVVDVLAGLPPVDQWRNADRGSRNVKPANFEATFRNSQSAFLFVN